MSILSQFKQSQNTDFPNVRPSLDLRFALAKKLDPRITFTRGTSGTYFGSDGLIKTAGVSEPRFDHDPITGQSLGLLIEESRSNLLQHSETFTGLTLRSSNLLTISTTAPDGTNSVKKLSDNTSAARFRELDYTGGGVTGTGNFTFSIFVKKAEREIIGMGNYSSSPSNWIFFNLTTESFFTVSGYSSPTTYGYIKYSNGWYRIWYTVNIASNSGLRLDVITGIDQAYTSYIGDGTSGIYVWGEQAEAGSLPTSYIPTSGSAVTRSADNADMTGTNFSSWYNQSEGTIYLETDKLYPGNFDAYRHHYKIDSGSNADQITAYILPGSTAITNYGIANAGRQVFDYQQIFIGSSPTQFKIAQSLNSKYSFFTSSKGTTPPQLPSKSAPNGQNLSLATNMSRLFIGNNTGGGQINSHISRFTYYPIQLTNQQLINLVS